MDIFLPHTGNFTDEGGVITVSAENPDEFEELQAYLQHMGPAAGVLSPNVANRENIRGMYFFYS